MLSFSEKDVLGVLGTSTNPIIRQQQENTFYYVCKITGANITYHKFVFNELTEQGMTGLVADFQDDAIYTVSTKAIVFPTLYKDAGTSKVLMSYKYCSQADAEADLGHLNCEFNPEITNGIVLINNTNLSSAVKV